MSEFDEPEMVWVEAHRDELIGLSSAAASELVRAAGFRPIIRVPRPGLAFAAAYWSRSVTMVCINDVVTRVASG